MADLELPLQPLKVQAPRRESGTLKEEELHLHLPLPLPLALALPLPLPLDGAMD